MINKHKHETNLKTASLTSFCIENGKTQLLSFVSYSRFSSVLIIFVIWQDERLSTKRQSETTSRSTI